MTSLMKRFNELRLSLALVLPYHIVEEIAVIAWLEQYLWYEIQARYPPRYTMEILDETERRRMRVAAMNNKALAVCRGADDVRQLVCAMKYFPENVAVIHAEIARRNQH
jgi:hypothetical protein